MVSADAETRDSRVTVSDGHLFIDRLVADGLQKPERAKVRADLGELTLSLTLADDEAFAAWAAKLDTVGAIDPGPWRVGPVSARVAVGRISGVRTVLALEVEHVDDAPPRPAPDAGSGLAARLRAAMARPRPTPGPIPPGPGVTPPPHRPPGEEEVASPAEDVLLNPSFADRPAGPAPASDPAPSSGPAPEPEPDTDEATTADHDFRDYLGADGRPLAGAEPERSGS